MVRKIIQWLLIFAIGIFALLVVVVSCTFIYVYLNRDELIARVSQAINESINGELRTDKISVDFFHYFPATSIHISGVSVRDSMFYRHQMEFLHASDVFIKINFTDLFSANPSPGNISLVKGSLYIFTDSSGYSNSYLFRNKKLKTDQDIDFLVKEVNLKNFRIVVNDQLRNRFHNVLLEDLKCGIHSTDSLISFALNGQGKVKMLAFNLAKGALLRDAVFNNNVIIHYHKSTGVLEVPEHSFYLNHYLMVAKGEFRFGSDSSFTADITAPRILFSDAIKLAIPKTEKLLSRYILERPLQIKLHLEGSLKPRAQPLVTVEMASSANTFIYKDNTFTQCRLAVSYTNQSDSSKIPSIPNTLVLIHNFSGRWNNVVVNSDEIRIVGFPFPDVAADISGTFFLRDVSKLPGGNLYNFSKGTGEYHAQIKIISDSISWSRDLHLNVIIKNGALVYEPRKLPFNDVFANIQIDNYDVMINSASGRSGRSVFELKGKAPGILNLDANDLEQSALSWEIKSDNVNLSDFTTFLGSRNKVITKNTREKSEFGKHLERYLDACRLYMKLDISKVTFDHFSASGLTGIVKLSDNEWMLEHIRFNHAGGDVKLSGKMVPFGDNHNEVTIKSSLKHVNISEVFSAFDNFSQSTITSTQINGNLDADIDLNFLINHKTVISQSSLKGNVDLNITDGELKGFQPMSKLSRFLFRKRDFSDIHFSEITNSFKAQGNEIYFDRMKVNTSVMELYIEGSYFLDGKTDMHFQIPLSNLKTRDWSELSDNITDKGDKGVNIYLHAETDEKGELRFHYDPLKKIRDKRDKR